MNIMDNNGGNRPSMVKFLTDSKLILETKTYHDTGGASQGNGEFGFLPAFLDNSSGDIYLSRHSDGRLAKIHLLDGLPDHLIIERHDDGRVKSVSKVICSGFILNDEFYTRGEAAEFVSEKLSKSA